MNYNNGVGKFRRLSDLVSPQISAVSGGRAVDLSEEDYIDAMAEYMPEIEEARYNREMLDERTRLDEIARKEARQDSNIATGLTAVETGIKAYPLLSKGLGSSGTKAATTTTAAKGLSGIASLGASAAGGLAGAMGSTKSNRELGKLGGLVKGKKDQERVAGGIKGAGAGALTGLALGGPVGAAVGGLYGMLSGISMSRLKSWF